MTVKMLGVDLAKSVFQLQGVDERAQPVLRKRVSRKGLLRTVAQLEPCVVAMEACGSSHYWAREIAKLGHEVRLIAPQYVKPFVRGQKNDRNDAAAICEAASRPGMPTVAIKRIDQQDLQGLHRVRDRLVGERTAVANEIRGLLGEYGIIVPKGVGRVRAELPVILEDAENGLSAAGRELIADLYEQLLERCKRIEHYEAKVLEYCRGEPVCRRLCQIPGIGPLTASALYASVGDVGQFRNGRHLSAWLGLVQRQHSSGGRAVLLGITKRGNGYLRRLLVHGARALLRTAERHQDRLHRWALALKERRGMNRAAVAVANKLARLCWALWAREADYQAVA